MRIERFATAALFALALAGCQPGASGLLGWYLSHTQGIEVSTSVAGTVETAVGGSQAVTVSFAANIRQTLTNLTVTSGLPPPSGWNGPTSFSCSSLSLDESCALLLDYAPTVAGSGTLQLSYSYTDGNGNIQSGTVSIPYRSSSNNHIVATSSPSGQVDAVVGDPGQIVQVTFTTDDGSPASGFAVTSNLNALPSGWSSVSGSSFSCARVSTGNGCELMLSYAPSAAASGSLELTYRYINNAGQSESGALSIAYVASGSNSVVGSVAPSGQIAVTEGGSESVTITFDTNDGNPATALSITSSLAALPGGWSSTSSSGFSCAQLSSGNGCQLTLEFAPTAVANGTLSLAFSYTNNGGVLKSGQVDIPYTVTTHDNVIGTTAPPGQINAVIGAGSQAVTVSFTTDDGSTATALSVTSNLSALPSGWSSTSGSGFSCATISSGNGCQLTLSYAPTAVGSGTLSLAFVYTDNAGTPNSGYVTIPYSASTHDSVIGTVSPSGQIAVATGGSQIVTVAFDTNDGNLANSFSITSSLSALPSGWSSTDASGFSCANVSSGNGCQLSLTFAPSAVTNGTLSLSYSYVDDAGSSQTGTVDIPYASTTHDHVVGTAAPSGTVDVTLSSSQTVSVTFDTDDGNTATALSVTSNLSALPSGWSSTSGSGFSCATVSSGNGCQLTLSYAPAAPASGTLTLEYSYTNNAGTPQSGTVSIAYGTYSAIGGTVSGLSGTLELQDNGTDTLSLSTNGSFTFATPLASGATYDVTVLSAPAGQTCAVANGSGTASGNVTGVSVSCAVNSYSIGGTISGLTQAGLVLTDNGGNALSVGVGASSFTFGSQLAYGSTYSVAVSTQPAGQTCTVSNGSGSVSGTVTSIGISCASNSYSIGGSISGLGYSGLVLTDDGGNATPIPAGATAFTFSTQIAYGDPYSVAVSAQPSEDTCTVSNGAGTVTDTVSNVAISCSTDTYSVGGTISGLTASGLVIGDNGGNATSISAGATSFAFSNQIAYGNGYAVAVITQPTGQTCVVASGSGTVMGTVNNVALTCTTNTYSVGGSISGLSAAGLVLTDNGGNATPISSGSTSFTFATQIAYGSTYSVAVSTQPTGQTCTVANGSGTATGTVTNVSVSCTTNTYSIGGAISGLSANGLVLTDDGGDALSPLAGTSSFTFATPLAYGASYAAVVSTQPTGQTCTVANGSGTVSGTVTSISISCTTNTYSIGGAISGLSANGLVLTDNGGNASPISSGSTAFTFSTQIAYGNPYSVAVSMQPNGELCSVFNGSGTVTGTVSNVSVSCTTSYTLGGTITGLNLSSVVLANGSATATVSTGASSWQFSSSFAANSSYSVNVQTQPSGEVCQVTGGGSGVLTGNVSNVTVACAVGLWTWEGGSSHVAADGSYGTEGVGSTSNIPGGRQSPSSWTDQHGNFWLFGGEGNPASGSSSGDLNDLWQYSSSSGQWTWVAGSSALNSLGTYGSEGVAGVNNAPGARWRANSWTDSGGNLWLFGGSGYGASGSAGTLNDLWQYSPSSGEWTWMSGSSGVNANGVYGSKGVAAAGNTPGARTIGVTWVDHSGNLWLFGGNGYGASGSSTGDLNDLWEYSPTTGEWTWIGGSNGLNATGTYGTKGVAAASNWPGSRFAAAAWEDANGNFWLFGGNGFETGSASGSLNDLWEYQPSSGEWTWVSGGSSINSNGVYGTEGVPAASNVPGSRYLPTSWVDSSGNFWLFGGEAYGVSGSGWINDLWYYTPSTGEWTWVSGSQSTAVSGVYGTEGTASVSNVPGARQAAVGWMDSAGNFWMFGGSAYDVSGSSGYINDLWRFTPY